MTAYPCGVEEVSRITGVKVRTLQHWRDQQYIAPATAPPDGRCARYSRRDVLRVQMIRAMLAAGLTIGQAGRAIHAIEPLVPRSEGCETGEAQVSPQ